MQTILRALSALCAFVILTVPALAAESGKYVVLPFKVNGPDGFGYLEKAVPSMLSSRLYWQGHLDPVDAKSGPAPTSADAAKKARSAAGADIAVWGALNIIGDSADVTMRVLKKDGSEWSRTSRGKVNDLTSVLQNLVSAANSDVFGRGGSGTAAPTVVQGLNPGLVHNETTPQQVYLNPQFRYQGADNSRLRSQTLPYASVSMAVADVTGDGKNNVLLLSNRALYVYQWGADQLVPVAEYEFPTSLTPLYVRTIDLNRDGASEVVVAGFERDYSEPYSYLLSFQGGKVNELAKRAPLFLNVAKMPPTYQPILIGQKGDSQRIFSRAGVHEVIRQGSSIELAGKIALPSGANIMNFVWLPGSEGREDMLVTLTEGEKLRVFGAKGSPIYTSEERFSGSAVGIAEQTTMPGMGKGGDVIPGMYWVPLRMLATDLDKNRQWELLVTKPVSTASQIFDRYRSFPEGEIQALFWDGVGLNLLWKTRRIKGTVADFDMADVNNDGMPDLVVNVNTHPGALGLKNARTMVIAYPLDLSSADPTTAPVRE